MRIALGLEYDGSRFAGWQSQAQAAAHVVCVQTEVERALSLVADHPVSVTAAGRTDAGVHAAMQVVHFDATVVRSERGWTLGANTHLPEAISLIWARSAPDGFHARYSAISRSYRYVILNRSARSSLERERVCWIREPLDAAAMQKGAGHLLGEHDFSSFRAAECQSRTPMRRVYKIAVARAGDHVVIDVHANAFLHHMVRNIAGVLIAVGRGQRGVEWPLEVLRARDRTQGGVTAPAQGLYLAAVQYADALQLPSAAAAGSWPMSITPRPDA